MSSIGLDLIGLVVNGIPEGLLDVLAIFVLTNTPFDKKKYALISTSFIISNFLIRLLPINYGVNTMLGLLVLVLIFVLFIKIDVSKLIKSSIVVLITLFICEALNLILLSIVFGQERTMELFNEPLTRALSGIPSLVIFAIIIYFMHRIIKKKDIKNNKTD